jgi:hypothetical protein
MSFQLYTDDSDMLDNGLRRGVFERIVLSSFVEAGAGEHGETQNSDATRNARPERTLLRWLAAGRFRIYKLSAR